MDREIISQDDAKEIHGIGTSHERMANGELRFRLTSQDGNDYIRTEASSIGSWQKAHFHTHLRETYIVENGWMAIAEDENGCMKINVYWPGEVATI